MLADVTRNFQTGDVQPAERTAAGPAAADQLSALLFWLSGVNFVVCVVVVVLHFLAGSAILLSCEPFHRLGSLCLKFMPRTCFLPHTSQVHLWEFAQCGLSSSCAFFI
jgi:hypothetical protein